MRILPKSGGIALCVLLAIVLALSSLPHSLSRDVKVVGDVEALGFPEIRKLKIFNVFSGLRVTVECKAADSEDHFVTRGSGEVDELGKFDLSVAHDDIVGDDGSLKEACYAHLQTASGNPCPTHDGLEASKIFFLSKSGEKHLLGLKGKLKFSPQVCISKFFWHMPKIKKPCPPVYKPPVVSPKKPCPPKIAHKPIQKPSVTIRKPPVVIPKKPSPPKIAHKPIYKSPDPIHKTPVVIPKKPSPPLHKSPVPIYKPPPVVVIPKKPCPPFPKFPFFPPKDITHPKFGKWPPFPSHP